jgi:anti-anti-sigma factor
MPIRPTESVVEFQLDEPRLTHHKMQPIDNQLDMLAHQTGAGTLRLDFRRVEHLTSMVLGKLVALHKHMRGAGGSLEVVNVKPELYDLFSITRLDTFLDVRVVPDTDGEGSLAVRSA